MYKILVTNDDGIDSPGIYSLVLQMRTLGDVFVVAPDRQQSAVGHALTVSKPLRATSFNRDGKMFGYAINGTPSDCVKLAINSLLKTKPDLVVSGINHGPNTSINVLYSGTVSAATEGMLLGIPSIAVSIDDYRYENDCTAAAKYTKLISEKTLKYGLPSETFLNVNVPNLAFDDIKGIMITQISNNIWKDNYEKRLDPFGRAYYWFAGELDKIDNSSDSDFIAVQNGYVSVSPIKYRFTDYENFDYIYNIFMNEFGKKI